MVQLSPLNKKSFLNFIITFSPFFLFNIIIIYLIFRKEIPILMVAFQVSYLEYLFIFVIKTLFDWNLKKWKIEYIDKKDKNKYVYYRDLLNELSIAEIGYLYNGKRKIKTLIIATIENLKLKKKIIIKEKNIEIIDKENLNSDEKYVADSYKFIDDKQFRKMFIYKIKDSLKEKGYLGTMKRSTPDVAGWLIAGMFIYFFGFIKGLKGNEDMFMLIEIILFIPFWLGAVIFGSTVLNYAETTQYHKTQKGIDVYLKIKGLKRFLNDYGKFDETDLKEIALWDEYILYAIILNEGEQLVEETKQEYEQLKNMIYKVR